MRQPWVEGIDGPYSLAASPDELAAAISHLLSDVLPFPPQRWPLLRFLGLLCRGELRSADMFRFQWRSRHFFMERHLDSRAVLELCGDPRLRQEIAKHIGEAVILWRSEIWVSRPGDCLIPSWHHDAYPRLLRGEGRSLNVYVALSDVEQDNGFEYLPPSLHGGRNLDVSSVDGFSGNRFFAVPPELEERAVRMRLRAGEFVLFSDDLVHRSVRNTAGQMRMALALRVAPPSLRFLRGYTPRYGPQAL